MSPMSLHRWALVTSGSFPDERPCCPACDLLVAPRLAGLSLLPFGFLPGFRTVSPVQSNNDRDRVLAATDLVAVIGEQLRLEPKGLEFVGICPFHDDSRPSMCVVPAKGFYHCFACGAHGNAIDFLINYHRIEFREALETLASRAGIELTRGPRRDEAEVTRRTEILRANRLAAGGVRFCPIC